MYMVSYSLGYSCGNKVFDDFVEFAKFVVQCEYRWHSYSLMKKTYEHNGISEYEPLCVIGGYFGTPGECNHLCKTQSINEVWEYAKSRHLEKI